MFSTTTSKFTTTLLLVVIISILCTTTALAQQVCKNGLVAFDPKPCTSCSTCTGSSSRSCCDATFDAAVGIGVNVLQLAKAAESCIMHVKMYSCAVCDPKNQQYYSSSGLTVCRSTCQKIRDQCGSASLTLKDCSTYPESNCWSAAPLLKQVNFKLLLVALLVSLIAIMF